jgi:hypothetical protein
MIANVFAVSACRLITFVSRKAIPNQTDASAFIWRKTVHWVAGNNPLNQKCP